MMVLMVTCLATLFWIASNIIHSQNKSTISPELKDAIEGVNPNFDSATLDQVQSVGVSP